MTFDLIGFPINAPASGSLATARNFHTATLLPHGQMLVAGGTSASTSTELFLSDDGSFEQGLLGGETGGQTWLHSVTLLPGGEVLIAGGFARANAYLPSAAARLYNTAGDDIRLAGSLLTARVQHTATLLPDGKVLVSGGADTDNVKLASAELYDPSTDLWSATGSLAAARSMHTATLLPSGKVLVAGGQGATALASAQLYDPATGLWTATGSLAAARYQHTATLLPTGKALVVGGLNGSALASAQLYDPAGSGSWATTGSLASARYAHTATLLFNGQVLVAAGFNGSAINSAQIYDPITDLWTPTGNPLTAARYQHTATLLPNDQVLILGGDSGSHTFSPTGERFNLRKTYPFYDGQVQASASFDPNGRLVVNGSGLRGFSGASGGNGGQDSPTNHPVVQLRRLDNDQRVTLLSDPASEVTSTAFISGTLPPLGSGHVLVTVIINGVPAAVGIIPAPAPGIVVEQPVAFAIADGGSRSFAATTATPGVLAFTVKNSGSVNLTGLALTKDGTNAADFTVTASPAATVAPGGSTIFTVRFAPTTTGAKTAALHLANNIPGKSPHDINLTGQLLSTTTDTDGDGMSDAAEFDLAAQGFNW